MTSNKEPHDDISGLMTVIIVSIIALLLMRYLRLGIYDILF